MFDLQDDIRTRTIKEDHPVDRLEQSGEPVVAAKVDPLDSEESVELQSRLMSYYRQEIDRQSENRFQMAQDEDYRDNIQWSEEDAQVLRDRGQAPLVYNVISMSVRWVINTEKRIRLDGKVLPRRKEESVSAEKKTQLLKYLSDVNRTPFSRSRAFEDAVSAGLGWMETAIQDECDGEPIYTRYESWRNLLYDSAAIEMDLSDARYMFRPRWLDVDIAKALIPGREAQIDAAAIEGSMFGGAEHTDGDEAMDFAELERENHGISRNIISHTRRRVRLIECWYKKPERRQRFIKGPWKGQIYDDSDPRHAEHVESIAERLTFTMHVAIMTSTDLLFSSQSPYRHNRYPFTPLWGYRRGRDGLPFGMIRGLRDIQDDINKRAAKAQYILNSNKVVMEEGAVKDIEVLRDEVAKPNGIIELEPGKMNVFKEGVDRELSAAQMDLMSRSIQMIQSVGGVTDEAMGRTTNAVAGVAIEARQEQASVSTLNFFDSLKFSEQLRGELELSLIEQYMTENKQFRITNMRGNADFVELNTGLPEDDITRSTADYVVSDQDYRATVRQAQSEQLVRLLTSPGIPPEVALTLLDLAVDGMDISNREEVVKRIRQVSGMRDPDANEPTPEEQQAEQQAAQEKAEQQQMIREMAAADLRKKLADAAFSEARARKEGALTERTTAQAIGDRVAVQQAAITAAVSIAAAPFAARIADEILKEGGWPQGAPAIPAASFAQQGIHQTAGA